MSTPGLWLRRHGAFLVILAVSFSWRLYFAVHWPIVQISDYSAYYNEARSLAGVATVPYTALNAWGPKLLYSAHMRVGSDDLRLLGAVNASLYSISLVFLYAGARSIFGGGVAILTTIVCLFSLSELYFTNLAATEIPATLFMSLIFWLMTRGLAPRALVALGVAIGLAAYIRSNMLVFPGLIFLYGVLRERRFWIPLRKAFLVQIVCLATLLPLGYLNQRHFGRFSPVVANSAALWWGNNPRLSGDFHSYPPTPEDFPLGSVDRAALVREYGSFYVNPEPSMFFPDMKPHDVSSVRTRYALGWIRQNPLRYLQLIKARAVFLFWYCTYGEVPYREYNPANSNQPRWRPAHRRLIERVRVPVRQLYRVLISLAMAGAVLTLARHRCDTRVVLPLMIVVWYSVPLLLTAAANRYKIPVLGLCWIYVAAGVGCALRKNPEVKDVGASHVTVVLKRPSVVPTRPSPG